MACLRIRSSLISAQWYELDKQCVFFFGTPLTSSQRDRGWEQVKFPCIGRYAFLEFSIGRAYHYDDILKRIKDGATLLDVGCCFGQDLRKLVYEGAPSSNLTGTELDQVFIDLGYELFKDRDSLDTKFIAGDIFSDDAYGLKDGSFDFIHAGSFFHQFTWAEQIEVLTKCFRWLKPQAGSMMVGRHIAVDEPEVIKHPQLKSGEAYHHNIDSWKKIVHEAAEKVGVNVEVEAELLESLRKTSERKWRMMQFCIALQ